MENINNLSGKIYLTCSACMSVWADGLSWANANPQKVSKTIENADNLVVLSCQVTDLAVLNDFRTLEKYYAQFPNKKYFVSGCLGKREDIQLPTFANRLETPRTNYQFLFDRDLVNFEKPFWINNFREKDDKKKPGHLFRDMYPLRIGKGCPNKCNYCTIRMTRGDFEQYDSSRLENEFLSFDNILLIADSPTINQLKDWHAIAKKYDKGFSIRNVEPSVVVRCEAELLDLAKNNLLNVFHSPIQSCQTDILKDMGRNVEATMQTMELARFLKNKGVYTATNIIIDYKDFREDFAPVYSIYDYVSWNPLWDRVWDRKKAEERFEKYLGKGAETNYSLIKIRELEARTK
jgi:tRNA A37 methylthiotransferase MiaB